jgi:hypothetical protein
MASPVSPSTAWEEIVKPDEDELFNGFTRVIAAQQEEVMKQTGGPLRRGFHAKLHAGLRAEFQVLADLPAYARCGVFSEPRVFPALVRFSNGDFHVNQDKNPEPRGIAIKLIGVTGRKLLPGQEDAVTQDFLATSHSVTSTVRDVRQFIAFIKAARNRLTLPFNLAREVGLGEAVRILKALRRTVLKSKVLSMATEQYSGTAPIKFGPYAVKFTVRPPEGTEEATSQSQTANFNFLREELADRLRKGDLMFDFLVQFFVDVGRTPIEDTSVHWEPDDAPFLKVAQVRIPGCDLSEASTNALSEAIDHLSFTPWHTTEDHRPLGNVMRARKVAYQMSSSLRGHRPEPTSVSLTEDV